MKKKRFLKIVNILIISIVALGMLGAGALSIFGAK